MELVVATVGQPGFGPYAPVSRRIAMGGPLTSLPSVYASLLQAGGEERGGCHKNLLLAFISGQSCSSAGNSSWQTLEQDQNWS